MVFSVVFVLMHVIVATVIAAPLLWVGGRLLVRRGRTSVGRAFLIVAVGAGVNAGLAMFVTNTLTVPVTLIVLVCLVKRFFQSGWKCAIVLGVGATILLTLVVTVLRFLPLVGLGIRL